MAEVASLLSRNRLSKRLANKPEVNRDSIQPMSRMARPLTAMPTLIGWPLIEPSSRFQTSVGLVPDAQRDCFWRDDFDDVADFIEQLFMHAAAVSIVTRFFS